MIWASWSDFWSMHGYGFFVWLAYGVTAVLLAAEVWLVARRRRRAVGAIDSEGTLVRRDGHEAQA